MSSRKSKVITYNIRDRGRSHTGQDRSDVNIRSMVDAINSPATQELVATGDLYGFWGHEVRSLYGMSPPDTVITKDGREVRISPAIRTVQLSADQQGNITHQQEFLENEAGEYAYQQYNAKIGGFSTAVDVKRLPDGSRYVVGFYGFDCLRTPNYHTNKGHGMFDGMVIADADNWDFDTTNAQVKQALENSIAAQYDCIYQAAQSQGLIDYYQQEAISAQNALMSRIARDEAVEKRKLSRKQEIFDSLICPSVPFELIAEKYNAVFDGVNTQGSMDTKTDLTKNKQHNESRNEFESQYLQGLNRLW